MRTLNVMDLRVTIVLNWMFRVLAAAVAISSRVPAKRLRKTRRHDNDNDDDNGQDRVLNIVELKLNTMHMHQTHSATDTQDTPGGWWNR